jgi:hypothetical protein
MPLYRSGSKGEEVRRIQVRLKEEDYYRGPVDGDFGGGTEAAVKAFQKAEELTPDGIVGEKTWKALFPDEKIPAPKILKKPLAYRCLALTGSFETNAPVPECFAGLSGDFDDQGISFGALQWNLGQGSLQPLLLEMDMKHSKILKVIFDQHYPVLRAMLKEERGEQLAWARSIQNRQKHLIHEPWHGLFKTLGRREECQKIQVKFAEKLYRSALSLCKVYGVRSERAAALMFDIKVQNGSIAPLVKAQIKQDIAQIPGSLTRDDQEVARLRIIANRRAEAANSRWVEDVRIRKLTIADGEGTVHGRHYSIEDQYGIRLKPAMMPRSA